MGMEIIRMQKGEELFLSQENGRIEKNADNQYP
jgi:hypothetical protein